LIGKGFILRKIARSTLRLAVLASALLSLSGCIDQRKEVFDSLLFTEPGVIIGNTWDDPVVNSIIQRAFPVGSQVSKLQAFVAKWGGKCTPEQDQVLSCKIVLNASYCWATQLIIEAGPAEGAITNIKSLVSGAGC
jgi:hypothetical protein